MLRIIVTRSVNRSVNRSVTQSVNRWPLRSTTASYHVSPDSISHYSLQDTDEWKKIIHLKHPTYNYLEKHNKLLEENIRLLEENNHLLKHTNQILHANSAIPGRIEILERTIQK